jgi:hypothetical protein
MKKVLLPLALIGALFLTACEKGEIAIPYTNESASGVKDKALECSCGGGSWDITDPEIQQVSVSNRSITANYDGTDAK